ncbi:MAG: hypothetical protein U0792_16905 [Gemmataceae bacterium]
MVLDTLHAALIQAADADATADLMQLRGLTDRMDSDLFLPFTGEELTSSLGTRVLQLCQIVDRTVERMAGSSIADTRNCRSSGGKHGVYSQYFRLAHAGCRLYFTPEGWSKGDIRSAWKSSATSGSLPSRSTPHSRRWAFASHSGSRRTSTGRGWR